MQTSPMTRRRMLLAAASVALAPAVAGDPSAGAAQGGGYPGGRAVTLIAPSAPGGGSDLTARALADALQTDGLIDHPLTVVNQPGGTGSVLLAELVTQHRGDPYRLSIASLPIMINELRGDSACGYRDVTLLARLITEHFLVVAPAASSYGDLRDLLDAVKHDASRIPIAAAGDDRLPFALLVEAAGGDPKTIDYVAFEGGGEQTVALLNGDVKAAIAGVSEFRDRVATGELRGLALLQDGRLDAPLVSVPTARELGYDVTLANWRGLIGPPGMPPEAVRYWQTVLEEMVAAPTWIDLSAQNQWEITFMQGDGFRGYLDETFATIETALRETGEIA